MVFDPTVTPKKAVFIFKALPVIGVFALLHGGVFAVQDVKTQPNPYSEMIDRNAFDLTDAPLPAKNTLPPEVPKNLDLKFTGIYRLKGVEKACLALIDSSAKPPETKYLQIPVGDKQGAIEITAIDAEAGTVRLIKDGSPLELNLKNNEHTYKTAVPRRRRNRRNPDPPHRKHHPAHPAVRGRLQAGVRVPPVLDPAAVLQELHPVDRVPSLPWAAQEQLAPFPLGPVAPIRHRRPCKVVIRTFKPWK